MKRFLLRALIIFVLIFLGIRGWIYPHTESYLQEIIQAYNRGIGANLVGYRYFQKDLLSAKSDITISFLERGRKLPWKNPLILPVKINYGPIVGWIEPALIELSFQTSMKQTLKPTFQKDFDNIFKRDIDVRYRGVLDWTKRMHEEIRIGKIITKDRFFQIEPTYIKSDYDLKSFRGDTVVASQKFQLLDSRRGLELTALQPKLHVKIREYHPKGAIFGCLKIEADELSLSDSAFANPLRMRFGGSVSGALLRSGLNEGDVEFGIDLEAKDQQSIRLWRGVRHIKIDLKLSNIGLKGLKELILMQRRRIKLQNELIRATGLNDDIAMQKAILALQMLSDEWVKVYNDLLISGKSRLRVDETLSADKRSKLVLDLTFTGNKLHGNAMSAMITLMSNLNRLVEGKFSLSLEKSLAKKLYPNSAFILDSMVSKGMASFKEGLYHLKGEIKGGKIIINGTRYAPQELLMMILI